jgi:hypothetical protein
VTESEVELTLTMRDNDHCQTLLEAMGDAGYVVEPLK